MASASILVSATAALVSPIAALVSPIAMLLASIAAVLASIAAVLASALCAVRSRIASIRSNLSVSVLMLICLVSLDFHFATPERLAVIAYSSYLLQRDRKFHLAKCFLP